MADGIVLDPRNARKHPDANKEMIRQSLEEVGAFRSIAVDGDGIIRAGNGVFEQAQVLGLKVRIIETGPDELIAVKRTDLRGELAERAAILDNRTGETSEWDADVLSWMRDNEPKVVDGLWDENEWRKILAQTRPESEKVKAADPEMDRLEELQAKWGTERGQIWEIPSLASPDKSHRLMCGDSTNPDQVGQLMGEERAILFATDPPYLVEYDGTNHPEGKDWGKYYFDQNQSVQGDGLYDGFVTVALAKAISPDAAWYCWHASRNQAMLEQIWDKHGAFVHQQIIWAKDRPVLGRSWYMWQHEPCFFGWLKGRRPRRITDEFLSSVWQFPTLPAGVSADHPTQKPIEIFTIPMLQHTYPGELCYEPFSGSGSQLVAAEMTGRICYAMEIVPQFVAAALERLAVMGLEPRLSE